MRKEDKLEEYARMWGNIHFILNPSSVLLANSAIPSDVFPHYTADDIPLLLSKDARWLPTPLPPIPMPAIIAVDGVTDVDEE